MSKPPEATRHHNSTKLSILLQLRAIYFSTFQYETPCTKLQEIIKNLSNLEANFSDEKALFKAILRIWLEIS